MTRFSLVVLALAALAAPAFADIVNFSTNTAFTSTPTATGYVSGNTWYYDSDSHLGTVTADAIQTIGNVTVGTTQATSELFKLAEIVLDPANNVDETITGAEATLALDLTFSLPPVGPIDNTDLLTLTLAGNPSTFSGLTVSMDANPGTVPLFNSGGMAYTLHYSGISDNTTASGLAVGTTIVGYITDVHVPEPGVVTLLMTFLGIGMAALSLRRRRVA